MAEKEGTQYASTGREESFKEQGEPRALHNVSTAIPKYAFQAKDMHVAFREIKTWKGVWNFKGDCKKDFEICWRQLSSNNKGRRLVMSYSI